MRQLEMIAVEAKMELVDPNIQSILANREHREDSWWAGRLEGRIKKKKKKFPEADSGKCEKLEKFFQKRV